MKFLSKALAKFLPPETRLRIAQSLINERGIRPLAREIGVNPKSVYKYKEGSANPGDEVMSKILAVAREEESVNLNKYLEELKNEFQNALELTFDPQDVLSESQEESKNTSKDTDEDSVDQRSTEKVPEKITDDERSTESMTVNEIFDKINVTSPFNQKKVEKIINSFSENPNPGLEEISEITGLSDEALENYLEQLVLVGVLDHIDDKFSLNVRVEGGG